ncbi:hypothetical protein VTN02DRAFT_3667 [Thermoascus thermophilus]
MALVMLLCQIAPRPLRSNRHGPSPSSDSIAIRLHGADQIVLRGLAVAAIVPTYPASSLGPFHADGERIEGTTA